MPPLETPPGEERSTEPAPPPQDGRRSARPRFARRGARYQELDQHELITLLDEVDDERSKARFRESIYIAVIVWLVLGWVMIYGPRYLWHTPVILTAPDQQRSTMTYLDTPPDLKNQLRKRPTPNISEKSAEAQSPKPSPRAPEPRAGTPAPPAPRPTPQPAAPQSRPQQQTPQQQPPPQQTARNTPPAPVPATPRPQPVPDAPAPSTNTNKNIFNNQQSASEAIQQAAKGARGGGESGDYGSTGRGRDGGNKQGVQVLSDMQGVDFSKYLARLLADIRRGWLPLIPEEARPPLNKQGISGVRFTILPDGKIAPGSMHLDYSTHDVAMDRAAWGSITGLGQAQPLPKEFHGPNLELRIEFRVNKDGPEAQ